ncbi:MAG: tetratricopeptide repeat protein [Polyangiaceae bacterium]|nr:tetratricopeptide repeat protein [Polyangiaceae bacterium]
MDALEMLQQIVSLRGIDTKRDGYNREAIEKLLAALERHPLSIELVAPHLIKSTPDKLRGDFRAKLDTFVNPAAEEDRNKSLRASLGFSTDRLGPEVKAVLPYLAWFQGGALEALILAFTQLPPEKWNEVRDRLVAVALLRVDDEMLVGNRPFLVFHPTLPFAAKPEEVPDVDAAEARFVEVYTALAGAVHDALMGKSPAGGMAVVAREDRNLQRATERALSRGLFQEASRLAEVVGSYLQSVGRPKDQARWAAWVQAHMAAAPPGPARWSRERNHARGLFLEGRLTEAVALLEAQLGEIERAPGDLQQRALCLSYLGQIWREARQPQRALPPVEKAIEGFEACGDQANLATALGDQANALMDLGRLAEALDSVDRGIALDRALGQTRNEAAALGRKAQILMLQHRFAEAEAASEEALSAANKAGDPALEGTTLQHQGALASEQGRFDLAVQRYQAALERFHAACDRPSEMRTADALGTAERARNQFEAAAAWYNRAEALATEFGAEHQLGVTAHNRGVLLQEMALRLPMESARASLLQQAVASIERSLGIDRKRGDALGIALSLFQLGVLHGYLAELHTAERNPNAAHRALDTAEGHLHEALTIFEPLDSPHLAKVYANLEAIAEARRALAKSAGQERDAQAHQDQAAAWRAKKEAKVAELEKLAGPRRLPDKVLEAFAAVCQAIAFSRQLGAALSLDAAETIASLRKQPEPFGAVGHFLDAIAKAEPPPPLPNTVPAELRELLELLAQSFPPKSAK